MVRLTSLLTGWFKKAGPVLGFGGLAVAFGLLGWLVWTGRIEVWWLVIPPVFALIGFLYVSRYTAVLVDDIQDAGDALLVHHRGRGWRIPLSTISEMTYSCIAQPPRIILVYRDAMGAVERLAFMPRLSTAMFALRPPPFLEDLRRRVDAARGTDPA